MDSQRGIEMGTMGCVSECPEEQLATSSADTIDSSTKPVINANDDTSVDTSTNAAIDMSTVAVIDTNTEAAIGTSTDVSTDTNTNAEMDANTGAPIDTNTDAAVNTNIDVAIDINTEAATDTSTETVTDINTNAAIDTNSSAPIDTNTDPATDNSSVECLNGSTYTDVGTSSDAFVSGSTKSDINAVVKGTDANVSEGPDAAVVMINDPVIKANSDVTLDVNTNAIIVESTNNSKEKGALNELKCTLSTGNKMIIHSGVTSQVSRPKSVDYNSEIEIIDCTSKSVEDQPATTSATVNNPSPEITINASNNASLDCNTEAAVISSSDDTKGSSTKHSRLRKKELYELRCKNLRLSKKSEKKKQKSGDTDQPSKSRTRINCLEKLTQNNTKFMENFDPKKSNREIRKLLRKTNTRRRKRGNGGREVNGSNGARSSSEKLFCDCMDSNCPGCHFPCPRCHSPKCGHECRVNRKWTYEDIEVDGTEIIIKPPQQMQNICKNR